MTKRKGPRYSIEELREALDSRALSADDIVAGYVEVANDRTVEPRDRLQALDRLVRLGFGIDPMARQSMVTTAEAVKREHAALKREVDGMTEAELLAEAAEIVARQQRALLAETAEVLDAVIEEEREHAEAT